jgi:hypothetical protein
MSRCEGTTFHAARSAHSHPIHASSRAMYVRARPDAPYKRYVTRECAASRSAVDRAEAQRRARAEALRERVDLADAALRAALPETLAALEGYVVRSGAVQADVARLVDGVRAMDPQGRAAMQAYFAGEGAELLTRVEKRWARMQSSSKQKVRAQVAHAQRLVDAPATQLEVRRAPPAECPNLRIRRNKADDWYDVVQMEEVPPDADWVVVTDSDGTSACAPLDNVRHIAQRDDGRRVSALHTVTHWNRQLAPTVLANVATLYVHPDGVATRLLLPVFRAARLLV